MALTLECKSSARSVFGAADVTRRFEGIEAQRVAAILLPKVNRYGASERAVAQAVQEIDAMGTAERFVDGLMDTARGYTRLIANPKGMWSRDRDFRRKGLFGLPAPKRLALEMALHEEVERRALEGELAELERAWRDAEEIAAIADDLVVPASVRTAMSELKKQ
jgi:hypothetical protein